MQTLTQSIPISSISSNWQPPASASSPSVPHDLGHGRPLSRLLGRAPDLRARERNPAHILHLGCATDLVDELRVADGLDTVSGGRPADDVHAIGEREVQRRAPGEELQQNDAVALHVALGAVPGGVLQKASPQQSVSDFCRLPEIINGAERSLLDHFHAQIPPPPPPPIITFPGIF
ncbi:hypothetical protein BS78_K298700 [Paspalum vaginatum]|uniref:Uncharacterized protein n=1 Tax=Paspalum vaginatum TaxID=158149 RepID=A0A9W8CDQ5_9POAL|nr:hypothetical protein BS78_K298700 [Paspalum vaginatum]